MAASCFSFYPADHLFLGPFARAIPSGSVSYEFLLSTLSFEFFFLGDLIHSHSHPFSFCSRIFELLQIFLFIMNYSLSDIPSWNPSYSSTLFKLVISQLNIVYWARIAYKHFKHNMFKIESIPPTKAVPHPHIQLCLA